MATATATAFGPFQIRKTATPTPQYSSLFSSPTTAGLLRSRKTRTGRVVAAAAMAKDDSRRRRVVIVFSSTDDRMDLDENPEGIISGEWPENFSLLSYDDLRAYLEPQILKDKMSPLALLGEVMSTPIRAARADQTLDEIDHHFEVVSGLPVVDDQLRCIGVISKKDKAKASNGLKSKVEEVMSSPPITLPPGKTVLDAAALMLKMKIHRIPIMNEERRVIGMVTRTDIFRVLEVVVV